MIVIALLATVLSVELLMVADVLLSQVPYTVDESFVHTLLPYQMTFLPPRNILLYVFWILLSTAIWAFLMWGTKSVHGKKWPLRSFLFLHVLVVFLMGHAAFEAVALGNPIWAWPLFWAAFVSGVLIPVFWPELTSGVSFLRKYYTSLKIKPRVGVVLGCLFIFLVIFMPDLKAVVAMVFMGDYFRLWDISLFGAVYALTHGLLPCIDVYTTYGFGAVVMVAKIVNLMGGFDYARVLAVMMWVGIIYFILWFLLLRLFLASTLLAFAAIVWAICTQMFNIRVNTFIWDWPMTSVLRYCFDIGVFWMLWMHIQTRRLVFLGLGAFFVSLALYHVLSTGAYLFLVFALYAGASAFVPSLGGSRNIAVWRNHALVIASVFVWICLWLFLSVGPHFLDSTFRQNLLDLNLYFLKGVGGKLLTGPIIRHDYVTGIGGLLLPVFYLWTFLYTASLVVLHKARGRDIFAGLLALYGLGALIYYIVLVIQWFSMGIVAVFIFFYWISKALEKAPAHWRKPVAWGLIVAALYCLFTDHLFTGYPNLLNFSRDPIVDSRVCLSRGDKQNPYFNRLLVGFPEMYKLPVNSLGEKDEQLKFESDFSDDAALKAYYTEQTAWPEDAALIRRLTPEGGKAAVLSSYEVLLLQRADRKPFFYYYPLLNSRPLTGRNFVQTYLFTYTEIQGVVDQLETQKPPYIFMERIFLTPRVPQGYLHDFTDLLILLDYINTAYKPVEVGKYLVAMKRK